MVDIEILKPRRRLIMAAFTVFVFVVGLIEIWLEFAAGETLGNMLDDLIRLVAVLIIATWVVYEFIVQRESVRQLHEQLNTARRSLALMSDRSRKLSHRHRDVIQNHFDGWHLSNSEQEVIIAVLKGLSFREIAAARDTREKTVRQQASTAYRKAGVANRNELAAWFFQDLLGHSIVKRPQRRGRSC